MNKVLILGGYGNFGKRISTALAKDGIDIVIAGRNKNKAEELIEEIKEQYPNAGVSSAIFDINKGLASYLDKENPNIVINTCGPFQIADYSIAKTCIEHKIHYIDLSDGRDFVNGITALNKQAKDNDVVVISGASTVPCLSSAVLEKYKDEFSEIESLVYGITPGQKTPRGLATTKSILTYLGKPIKSCAGNEKSYGWQGLYRQKYPKLGNRLMANCDIPDLDLLPKHYGIKSIRFSAGMESGLLHLGIWALSWIVRIGTPFNLQKYAGFLLKASHLFDWMGTENGGMHMIMRGKDKDGKPKEIKWFIIAMSNDGPQIPCIPAIVLAKKLLRVELEKVGAFPCVGLVSLGEYMEELEEFDMETFCI